MDCSNGRVRQTTIRTNPFTRLGYSQFTFGNGSRHWRWPCSWLNRHLPGLRNMLAAAKHWPPHVSSSAPTLSQLDRVVTLNI